MRESSHQPKMIKWLFHAIIEKQNINTAEIGVLGIDASRKKASDGFNRSWPQVVMSDDATIKSVDEKWESALALKFVSSPSLRYKALSPGDSAVWKID